MSEVLDKHEIYVTETYPGDALTEQVQEVEDAWLREVTDKFEHLEVAIKASIIVVEDSTPHQKQSKVKLTYKYDEVLLLTAIESLYSVI